MNIKILGTGSSGNCYVLEENAQTLILDAGIDYKKIRQGTNFTRSPILITHEHEDHSKAVKRLLKQGNDVYATKGTLQALNVENDYYAKTIQMGKSYKIDNYWIVSPFESMHDAKEPCNYQIKTNKSNILYITDTSIIPYTFKNTTHILIEVDYTQEELLYNQSQSTSGRNYQRIQENHLELEQVKKFLKETDISKLKEIYIVHTSLENCNTDKIKEELKDYPIKIGREEMNLK